MHCVLSQPTSSDHPQAQPLNFLVTYLHLVISSVNYELEGVDAFYLTKTTLCLLFGDQVSVAGSISTAGDRLGR